MTEARFTKKKQWDARKWASLSVISAQWDVKLDAQYSAAARSPARKSAIWDFQSSKSSQLRRDERYKHVWSLMTDIGMSVINHYGNVGQMAKATFEE